MNQSCLNQQMCVVWAWWRHQMETFSALLAICAGISPVPVNSPHKGQWRGALMFSLICVWINGWVNNSEAGDLRRYRAHYDVTVMGRDGVDTLPFDIRAWITHKHKAIIGSDTGLSLVRRQAIICTNVGI